MFRGEGESLGRQDGRRRRRRRVGELHTHTHTHTHLFGVALSAIVSEM